MKCMIFAIYKPVKRKTTRMLKEAKKYLLIKDTVKCAI